MDMELKGRRSIPVLTPADMRAVEQGAFALGVPSLLLMEEAARGVATVLKEMLPGRDNRVLFVCGSGNNGGDGLAAARIWQQVGGQGAVLMQKMSKTPDAKANFHFVQALHIPVYLAAEEDVPSFSRGFDGYVDALLGTGISGEPDGETSALIRMMNDSGKPILSVDMPSGMEGKGGLCPGEAVQATVTVTFHAVKPGLLMTPFPEKVGKIIPWDIGLFPMAGDVQACVQEMQGSILTKKALAALKHRPLNAHKGTFGRIGIFAGSMGLCGAAAMCAEAAIHAGGGLVTLISQRDALPVLQKLVPNAMCMDIEKALEAKPAFDVQVLGCGLGQEEKTWQQVKSLYDPAIPSVWDADALNLLARDPFPLGEGAVITPHPGEAARLLHRPIQQILADVPGAARALCEKYHCTAVLKSHVTVICHVEAGAARYLFNTAGSPAMAKGGSGDVLAGMLGVLLHQERDPLMAAGLSCLWHGLAGQVGEKRYGLQEMTARDLISCFKEAREG